MRRLCRVSPQPACPNRRPARSPPTGERSARATSVRLPTLSRTLPVAHRARCGRCSKPIATSCCGGHPHEPAPRPYPRGTEAARDVTHPSRALTVSNPDCSIGFYEEPIGEQGAGKQKSRRADSKPLSCSLRVRSHAFTAVSRGFRKRLRKSYLFVLRFWMFPDVRSGYCLGYCQTVHGHAQLSGSRPNVTRQPKADLL